MERSSATTTAATTTTAQQRRQQMVITPSDHIPWSVEVISTMPKELIGKLHEYDTGAVVTTTHGPISSWVCLGLSSEGNFFVYPQQQHQDVIVEASVVAAAAATPSSRRTTTVSASTFTDATTATTKNAANPNDDIVLLPPKHVGHLFHAKLKCEPIKRPDHDPVVGNDDDDMHFNNNNHQTSSSSTMSCLVALERRDHGAVQIYALHPTTGQLFAKKLTPQQVRTSIVMPFSGYTRMEIPTSSTTHEQQQPPPNREVFCCLATLAPGLLVAGTCKGRLWLVKCTAVPMSLHVYPLIDNPENSILRDDSSSSSSYSLLGRIFGTTPSKKKMRLLQDGTQSSSMAVKAVLPLPSIRTTTTTSNAAAATTMPSSSSVARFWMVTHGGTIVAFHPTTDTTTAAASSNLLPWNYSPHIVGHLKNLFSQEDVSTTDLQVLQAAMDPTPLLYDPQEGNNNTQNKNNVAAATASAVAHFIVQTQGRLYWMTATATLATANNNSTTNFTVLRVHWLNRFPDGATIHVEGLVVAENRMAYATMTPQPRGGPVLIMALDTMKLLPLTTFRTSGKNDDDNHDEDDDDEGAMFEVDLPLTQVPSLLPHTLTLDRVTHGCTIMSTSGIGLRVRCIPPTQRRPKNVHQSKSSHALDEDDAGQGAASTISTNATATANTKIQSSKLLTLTSHLRSAFWHFYQHSYEGSVTGSAGVAAVIVPPSLEQASLDLLEAAVVSVGQQLQQQPGDAAAASSQNPLDWHLAYIRFLQQGGLYRKLSTCTKYKLMGIGQEVVVFANLLQQTNQQQDILTSRLRPHDIASWFYEIAHHHQFLNDSVSSTGGTSSKEQQDARVIWCAWLCLALRAATSFRLERAMAFYDIPVEPDPWIKSAQLDAAVDGTQYLWTSQRQLQTAMVELLQYWNRSRISTVQQGLVETMVQISLQSFADSCFAVGDQVRYAQVKDLAIPLLRTLLGRDDVAFTLAVDHCYFEGLCQIAKDHEKKHDEKKFCLDAALFVKLQDCVDVSTGLAFGPFCLRWHVERRLFGHVLNLGYHCCPNPNDLNELLHKDERLFRYRWIHSVRQGDYHAATENLLMDSKDPDVSLTNLNLSLSLAKLSNLILEKEDDAGAHRPTILQRRQYIDNQHELIQAQVLLMGKHPMDSPNIASQVDKSAPFHLRSADELLSMTLIEKMNQAKDQDDRADLCMLGLGICMTMDNGKENHVVAGGSAVEMDDDGNEMILGAARVWAKTILLESPLWLEWIQTQPDLTDPELMDLILESTVFGRVLKQCWNDDNGLTNVTFGPSLERPVLALLKWDHVASTQLQRLLRHVFHYGQNKSDRY